MEEIKVISKQFNQKDELVVDSETFKQAVENVLSGELGNIDVNELPHIIEPSELTREEVENYKGKAIYSNGDALIFYPCIIEDTYVSWFAISSDTLMVYAFVKGVEDWELEDYYKYNLSYIKEIYANPTLEGTESALTGLQVGSTKYRVANPLDYRPVLHILDVTTEYAFDSDKLAKSFEPDAQHTLNLKFIPMVIYSEYYGCYGIDTHSCMVYIEDTFDTTTNMIALYRGESGIKYYGLFKSNSGKYFVMYLDENV